MSQFEMSPIVNVQMPAIGYFAMLFIQTCYFQRGSGTGWGRKECAAFYDAIPQCGFSFQDFWGECEGVMDGNYSVANPFS